MIESLRREPQKFVRPPADEMGRGLRLVDGEFDSDFYSEQYPDVGSDRSQSLLHFMQSGWFEGRNPNASFDCVSYLELNPDVAAAQINPFLHFLRSRRSEKRQTRPSVTPSERAELLFGYRIVDWVDRIRPKLDLAFYIDQAWLQLAEKVDPVAHFAFRGWRQGFSSSAGNPMSSLKAQYPQATSLLVNPLLVLIEEEAGRFTVGAAPFVGKILASNNVIAELSSHTEPKSPDNTATPAMVELPPRLRESLVAVAGAPMDISPQFTAFLPHTPGEPPQETHPTAPLPMIKTETAAGLPLGDKIAADIRDKEALAQSGLLITPWYLLKHPDIAEAQLDPIDHFFNTGWRENRQPNPYFYPRYYAAHAMADEPENSHPLLHYLRHGERAGHRPAPFFDPAWYRKQHELSDKDSALGHYLSHAESGTVTPIPEFDVEFYLKENPDVRSAGIDPFLHFLESGYREGRDPSADFDVKFYARRHLGGSLLKNPILDYLERGSDPSIPTRAPAPEKTWSSEIRRFTTPGPAFETFRPMLEGITPRAKLLAFYLPQFHAFPENDQWWGAGFTEWTNIVRGAPRFEDHFQPRVPRDLGFYDLLSPSVMQRQIDLARAAGIFGFVFYFYWFQTKRLMEKPVDNFIADRSLDFPFCLMWANENWTRRWDGLDEDVLISQDYAEADDEALVQCWLEHFRDPRYIRIDERPVMMIYRPGVIPGAKAKIARWRGLVMQAGERNPVFVMAQGFGDLLPEPFGVDGAIEFPPHKIINGLTNINQDIKLLDQDFSGTVFSYEDAVVNSTTLPAPDYPLIKTAFPSWDNDARRQGGGMVVHGSTPESYQNWLEQLIAHARHHPFLGESFVCINAWNEWAEGAYLEPDLHFGAAYLNATARALKAEPSHGTSRKLCLVGHDAHPHGAQLLLQHLAGEFVNRFGNDVEIILLDGGRLVKSYQEIAPTTVILGEEHLRLVFQRLFRRGFRHVVVNSTASSNAVEHASAAGLRPILLVHELPSLIAEKKLGPAITRSVDFANQLWFPAIFVREQFTRLFPVDPARTVIQPQGSYNRTEFSQDARTQTRVALNIQADLPMVLAAGFADLRKGFDIFLNVWRTSERRQLGAHFVWIGQVDPDIAIYLADEIEHAKVSGRFHMIPFTNELSVYYAAADVFMLSSREDPFPTVVLLALQSGLPIIAFSGSGGIPELLRQHDAGCVVAMADAEAVADAVVELHSAWPAAKRLHGNRLARFAAEHFSFTDYAFKMLQAGPEPLLKISVVVPNYNYARHLKNRLYSIFNQNYPVFEIIVLDDRSTDNSIEVLERIRHDSGRMFNIVANEVNSGSVFRQWRKAAQLAKGDYLWIAEADDDSASEFLPRLAAAVRHGNDIGLAYSDSQAIDEDGHELSASYKFYYNEGSPGAFEVDRQFSGLAFIEEHLCDRNLILNVSGCLWRREALLGAMDAVGDTLFDYRIAGDWLLYVQALSTPGIGVAYVADPLNRHRRHVASVTHSSSTAKRHVEEVRSVQAMIQSLFPDNQMVAKRQLSYQQKVAMQLGEQIVETSGGPE